jgi:hypothetical protein
MVAPSTGNWLSNPVSWPPSSGATRVIVVVTAPEITIRAGRSHLGCRPVRLSGLAALGHHRTIAPIPPSATTAPTTGGTATSRVATASATYTATPAGNATSQDRRTATIAYPRSNPAATNTPGNELAAAEAANPGPCVSATSKIAGPDVNGNAASNPPTPLPKRRCAQVTRPIRAGESRNIAGLATTPQPSHRPRRRWPQNRGTSSSAAVESEAIRMNG